MRDFKRETTMYFRSFWIIFVVNVVLALAVFVSAALAVYTLFKFFGIVGE